MIMSHVGLETKIDSAAEGQQQFNSKQVQQT
jgi:hypothetical protein